MIFKELPLIPNRSGSDLKDLALFYLFGPAPAAPGGQSQDLYKLCFPSPKDVSNRFYLIQNFMTSSDWKEMLTDGRYAMA